MATRKGGRPPAGKDDAGRPVRVSTDYAQITLRVPQGIKADLEFLSVIEGRSLSGVVQSATDEYVQSRSASTRKALYELRRARSLSRPRQEK